MKTLRKWLVLLMLLCITGCNCDNDNEKSIIGIYEGDIIYCEEGCGGSVVVCCSTMKLTIFTDEIPTSSKYRAKIEVDTFVVAGLKNPWKGVSYLEFPEVTTEHNINYENSKYVLQMGETTAEFGFPIAFLVCVKGYIDSGYHAKINLEISSSFGIGKKFVFEGNRKWLKSIPVKVRNLTSSLEKPAPIIL